MALALRAWSRGEATVGAGSKPRRGRLRGIRSNGTRGAELFAGERRPHGGLGFGLCVGLTEARSARFAAKLGTVHWPFLRKRELCAKICEHQTCRGNIGLQLSCLDFGLDHYGF